MSAPWYGPAVGAGVGGGFDLGSQALGAHFAKSQQDDAQDWAWQYARYKYQWMVKDLRDAGLNPALAYGNPPGGAGVPTVSVPGGQSGASAISGAKFALTAKEVYKQMKEKTAQEKEITAQQKSMTGIRREEAAAATWLFDQAKALVSKTRSEAGYTARQTRMLDTQETKLWAEYNKLMTDWERARPGAERFRHGVGQMMAGWREYIRSLLGR